MCVAPTGAEAEDIAAEVTLEYDELPAVSDMLDALKPGASRVHEAWSDNVFIEVREERNFGAALDAAPIKVRRRMRCPFRGRCVLAIEGTCDRQAPPESRLLGGQRIACHRDPTDLAYE